MKHLYAGAAHPARYPFGDEMVHTWNKEYYDILNFYYWEPQHLGKIKNRNNRLKSLDDVLAHIARMEVSLNHQFNIFFQLLSNSLLNSIFTKIIPGYQHNEKMIYQSIESVNRLNLNDATQPDVFFEGERTLVGIEFKIASKSSIEQILKYAMLFYFSQERTGQTKECHLLYIGCTNFNDLFKEKFICIDGFQNHLIIDFLEDNTKKGSINLLPHKEKILNIAKKMSVNFINYQNLYNLFNEEESNLNTSSSYYETVSKLFKGINNELLLRGLAKA